MNKDTPTWEESFSAFCKKHGIGGLAKITLKPFIRETITAELEAYRLSLLEKLPEEMPEGSTMSDWGKGSEVAWNSVLRQVKKIIGTTNS